MPTWNDEVVHVAGAISFQHDDQTKRAAVGLLTRPRERCLTGGTAWRMADAPEDYMQQMLAGIVAFRMTMKQTHARAKLSQNREARDHPGAVEGQRASGHVAMADRMAARIRITE